MTDIEGSTALWERDPKAMSKTLAQHDRLFERLTTKFRGELVKKRGEGDSMFCVFASAGDAVACAWEIRSALQGQAFATAGVAARMAIHTGEPEMRGEDYYGSAVNRCARLRSAVSAGQLALSQTTKLIVERALPEGAALVQITSDPDEAARAPMGDAIVADVALTLRSLLDQIKEASRDAGPARPDPEPGEVQDPITGTAAMNALGSVFPDDGIVVLEAPSSTLALRNQLRISRPGSYYFGAGGGLGFGLAAAVGVQLAQPTRPVVCVIGEGSLQYAVTALWTAAAYEVPLTVLVLRNEEYAILKWFQMAEQVEGAPGLDLPALESAAIGSAYGVESERVADADQLREALTRAIGAEHPRLVEVPVAPGMWLA